MTDQEVLKKERKATADLYLKQTARIQELETLKSELQKFMEKFIDNFVGCDTCAGTGIYDDGVSACPDCGGTALQIVSRGVLLSELYPEACIALEKIISN